MIPLIRRAIAAALDHRGGVLAVAVVGIVLLVSTLAGGRDQAAIDSGAGQQPAPAVTAAPTAATPATVGPDPTPTATQPPNPDTEPVRDRAGGTAVAAAWIKAYADPKLPQPKWLAQVTALSTGYVASTLPKVNRTLIPTVDAKRAAPAVMSSSYGTVTVPTTDGSGLTLVITVVIEPPGVWRVSQVVPQ